MTTKYVSERFKSHVELREYNLHDTPGTIGEVLREACGNVDRALLISSYPNEMGTKSGILRAIRRVEAMLGMHGVEVLAEIEQEVWLKVDCTEIPVQKLGAYLNSFWIVGWGGDSSKAISFDLFYQVFELDDLEEQVTRLLERFPICAKGWYWDQAPLLQIFRPVQ